MKTQRRGGRTRRPRNDKGQLRWTERDIQVQGWIGEQYAVRIDHLQHLLSRQPPLTDGVGGGS